MTETLSDVLRHSAEAVSAPSVDVAALVARAGKRQRRRWIMLALAATAVVGAATAGSLAGRGGSGGDIEPAPSPSPAPPSSVAVDPTGTRTMVYAAGSTLHVGDETFEASKPVAFIDATDDGAVYEAANDCTLWFTDGTTASVIGKSPWTAAPTARYGSVVTGDSGSLVVWGDVTSCKHQEAHGFVVYDTSRREVVRRIPSAGAVLYVDEDQVYFSPRSDPGCWVQDLHACGDPHLFRYDVTSGETTKLALAEWDADLSTHTRMFVAAMPGLVGSFHDFHQAASFSQVGARLVHADPVPLTTTSGEKVRLRLPNGWTAPGAEGSGGMIQVSQWLDDDTVVLWADDGGGDLPAKNGDLLVCRLPDGTCRVAVARSARDYVAPYRASE